MLRCETVGHGKHTHVRGISETSSQTVIRVEGAEDKPTTVELDTQRVAGLADLAHLHQWPVGGETHCEVICSNFTERQLCGLDTRPFFHQVEHGTNGWVNRHITPQSCLA